MLTNAYSAWTLAPPSHLCVSTILVRLRACATAVTIMLAAGASMWTSVQLGFTIVRQQDIAKTPADRLFVDVTSVLQVLGRRAMISTSAPLVFTLVWQFKTEHA